MATGSEDIENNEPDHTSKLAYDKLKRLNDLSEDELLRVQAANENLTSQLEDLEQLNKDIVSPEIETLQFELSSLQDDLSYCINEVEQSEIILLTLHKDLMDIRENRLAIQSAKIDKSEELIKIKDMPKVAEEDCVHVQMEIKLLNDDLNQIVENNSKLDNLIAETTSLVSREDTQLSSLSQTLEKLVRTDEEKRESFKALQRKLDVAKLNRGELVTSTLQLEMALKEMDESKKCTERSETLLQKQLETTRRVLKRKQLAFDTNKQLIPQMVAKISDFEREISMQNDCNMKIGKDIERIKGAIRNKVRMISHHDHNREDLRVNLEKVMQSVDDTENKIRLATVENNKLEKMVSLLAVHMEILTQKVSALTATEDEINQQIRIKSQIGSDLKQNLQECSKRLTDISNLHSILRKERDIIVAARLASSAKIANMEKDISDAKSALESALTDFEQKTIILAKHQESHVIGRILRSSLQGEKTESSLKLREKIEETKMQHRRLENLRLTLFTLQREISLQKSRNQNVSKEKEALSKKLAETMSAIYRSNQRARLRDRNCKELEISIRQRRDDVRLLILKEKDLLHSITCKRKNMIDCNDINGRIAKLQSELQHELINREKVKKQLEHPTNARVLSDEHTQDPDDHELDDRILAVESKIDESRGRLLQRNMIRDDIAKQVDELKTELSKQIHMTKPLLEKLNRQKSESRTTTRRMMASLSELSMYQMLRLKLEIERDNVAKELVMEDNDSTKEGSLAHTL